MPTPHNIARRFIPLLLMLVGVVNAASASNTQPRTRIAIFDPVIVDNDFSKGTNMTTREIIQAWMVNNVDAVILERSLLKKILEEQKFSNSDAVDESQASELGKLAGANKVMLTVISRANEKDMISIKFIDVETASIESQQIKMVKPENVFKEIPSMLSKMFKDMSVSKKSKNPIKSIINKIK